MKIRDDVINLLNHAAKKQNFDVQSDFLKRIVPLLYRDIDTLTEMDHVELWDAYNKLSIWLAPVTAESLRVAEELRQKSRGNRLADLLWVVGGILFTVVGVQIYSTVMTASMAHFAELEGAYAKVLDSERVARLGAPDKVGDAKAEPLRSIIAQKKAVQQEMFLSAKGQCDLQLRHLGRLAFHSASVFCEKAEPCEKWMPAQAGTEPFGAECAACPLGYNEETLLSAVRVMTDAGKTINVIVNSLLLPFLLGILGAAAFLSRTTLARMGDSSLVRSWPGQYWLRLLLGGLLGVMGPLLYSSGNVEKIGLGLALFAFLLGYSVEVAFGLFDQLISYARAAIKPESKTEKTPNVDAADSVAAARRQLGDIRTQLRGIKALGPILKDSLPKETFELEVGHRIKAADDLLVALGSELDSDDIDPADLVKKVADAAAQCKDLCGAQHPLTGVLGTALGHFDLALGSAAVGDRSAAIVSSLFAGAVAASKKGPDIYARWNAYVLSDDRVVWPTPAFVPGPGEALKCLNGTIIFKHAFDPGSDVPEATMEALALQIMALAPSDQSTEQLAQVIWDGPAALNAFAGDLHQAFGDVTAFAAGWAEYRHKLIGLILEQRDFPEPDFPEADVSALPVRETLAAVDQLRLKEASKGDLDILGGLADATIKAARMNRDLDVLRLIRRLLPFARVAKRTL